MNERNLKTSPDKSILHEDDASLQEYFASLHQAADVKDYIEQFDSQEWPRLLRLVDDLDKRAEVVALLDEPQWEELRALLTPKEIAELIQEMESDDAADFIANLPDKERIETLRRLPYSERVLVQQLLRYPEDSAGGIMQIELAQVLNTATVADAIKTVRQLVEDEVEILAVWVVDSLGKLVGSIALEDLLLNKSTTQVSTLMETDIVSVKPSVDQEKVAALFKKYNLITLPVVDNDNVLLGRIVIDDVLYVVAEEAQEDALKMGGTRPEELMYQEKVFATARIRLPWLSVALISSLVSASLLHFFEGILHAAFFLFPFVPVVTAMGGSTGLQSATVLISGMSSGRISIKHVPRILFKEMRVGLLMSCGIGLAAAAYAMLVISPGNIVFGMVVLASMIMAMFIAATLGVCAPALLRQIGVDPAIAAGPFLAPALDIIGILIYLGTSSLILNKLA